MHKFDQGGSARQIAYHEYLRSDHWIEIKKNKRMEAEKKCAACGDMEMIQLHHMRYRATFEETELRDTCWLCKGCHTKFHHRAGVKLKDTGDDFLLLARTIKVINRGAKSPVSKPMTRRQCRVAKNQAKREAKAKRRAIQVERDRIRAEKIALGIFKPKKPNKHSDTNRLLSQIKPRSALRSSMAGVIVFVKK